MKLRQEIRELEVVPKGFGMAYRSYDRRMVVCYPIPLNLLIRWSRDWYFRCALPRNEIYIERLQRLSYLMGLRLGRKVSEELLRREYERGKREGLEEFRGMMREALFDEARRPA